MKKTIKKEGTKVSATVAKPNGRLASAAEDFFKKFLGSWDPKPELRVPVVNDEWIRKAFGMMPV